MTSMPHLAVMEWDYADRLKHTRPLASGTDQNTYFTYDAAGQRVRKVFESVAGGLVKERIYLGRYEIYRERATPGGSINLERQTLHVMDDKRRVAIAETKTIDGGAPPATITALWRFQLDNHLGSALLEVDETGNVITYEEYHPYGSSSFQAAKAGIEVSTKRYRYTGKERDDETGLYYHGARYYAPWLGRWTAADPAQLADGTNVYRYVRNNPLTMRDATGMLSGPPPDPQTAAKAAEAAWSVAKSLAQAARTAPPAAAAAAEAAAGTALVEAAAAIGVALFAATGAAAGTHLELKRLGSLGRYGNPLGQPKDDIAFPLQRFLRENPRDALPQDEVEPQPETATVPEQRPDTGTKTKEEERKDPRLGRIYVTYTKYNDKTNMYYSGRTSAIIDLDKPLRPQAIAAIKLRDLNHHVDETIEPGGSGFRGAELDKFDVGTQLDYRNRYKDLAYLAIRGREQQLIDSFGGAQSDTAPIKRTENAIRGVAKDNPYGRDFHEAANLRFRELHPYTGTLPP